MLHAKFVLPLLPCAGQQTRLQLWCCSAAAPTWDACMVAQLGFREASVACCLAVIASSFELGSTFVWFGKHLSVTVCWLTAAAAISCWLSRGQPFIAASAWSVWLCCERGTCCPIPRSGWAFVRVWSSSSAARQSASGSVATAYCDSELCEYCCSLLGYSSPHTAHCHSKILGCSSPAQGHNRVVTSSTGRLMLS
jgi:hypothetical protein